MTNGLLSLLRLLEPLFHLGHLLSHFLPELRYVPVIFGAYEIRFALSGGQLGAQVGELGFEDADIFFFLLVCNTSAIPEALCGRWLLADIGLGDLSRSLLWLLANELGLWQRLAPGRPKWTSWMLRWSELGVRSERRLLAKTLLVIQPLLAGNTGQGAKGLRRWVGQAGSLEIVQGLGSLVYDFTVVVLVVVVVVGYVVGLLGGASGELELGSLRLGLFLGELDGIVFELLEGVDVEIIEVVVGIRVEVHHGGRSSADSWL